MERDLAAVRIEKDVWIDFRFRELAKALGITPFEAISRCAIVWARATWLETDVLPANEIDRVADFPGFSAAMISPGELAEPAPEGIRLCGGRDRLGWLAKKRLAAGVGGRARSAPETERRD